jgi:hypothetical protein
MPAGCLKNEYISKKDAEILPIIRIVLKEGMKEFVTSPEILDAGNQKKEDDRSILTDASP